MTRFPLPCPAAGWLSCNFRASRWIKQPRLEADWVRTYSIFGITIDRKHIVKSARPQGATTLYESRKDYAISENAVVAGGRGGSVAILCLRFPANRVLLTFASRAGVHCGARCFANAVPVRARQCAASARSRPLLHPRHSPRRPCGVAAPASPSQPRQQSAAPGAKNRPHLRLIPQPVPAPDSCLLAVRAVPY